MCVASQVGGMQMTVQIEWHCATRSFRGARENRVVQAFGKASKQGMTQRYEI